MADAAAQSVQPSALALQGPLRAWHGFVHGSRWPSLTGYLSVPALPAAGRTQAEAALAKLVPGWPSTDGPDPASGGGQAEDPADPGAASLGWLLMLVDRCQQAAGLPVFEPARAILPPGPHGVLCQFPTMARSLRPLSALLPCLLRLLPVLLSGSHAPSLTTQLVRLHQDLAQTNFRSSNVPRFIRAAHDLALPFAELPGQVIQYGEGARACWMDSTFTGATPFVSTVLARSKLLTCAHLARSGLPVPRHRRVGTLAEAQAAAASIGYPVVVKPADLDGGLGVAPDLRNAEELAKAYEAARRHSANIVVEQHIAGRDYRLTVLHGEVIWAVERVPAGVTGDGTSSIAELVARTNADPRRGTGEHSPMKRLVLDDEAQALLARERLSPVAVPPAGRFVRLRRAANVASGGTPVAVFDQVHPDNARLAVRAAAALRLDLAGVDLLIPDITRSWREGGAAICEVNAQPQLGGTTSAHVYPQVLRALVPGDGRLPCAILAGFDPADPLPAAVARLLQERGLTTGCHTPQGVALGGEALSDRTLSLFAAGQMLVANPACEAMVLCLTGSGPGRAAGDSLDQGLPVPRCDVLVIGPLGLPADMLIALEPACDTTIAAVPQGNPPLSASALARHVADAMMEAQQQRNRAEG